MSDTALNGIYAGRLCNNSERSEHIAREKQLISPSTDFTTPKGKSDKQKGKTPKTPKIPKKPKALKFLDSDQEKTDLS